MSQGRADASFNGGHQVLDLGEPFQAHQFGDLHRSVFANAAEIVAQQIGDHHQLRHLLTAALEFIHPLCVPNRIGAARPCSLDGASEDMGSAEAKKQLRRRGCDREVFAIQEGGERGRGNLQQSAEECPASRGPRCTEALGQVDLIDVATADPPLCRLDGTDEFCARH